MVTWATMAAAEIESFIVECRAIGERDRDPASCVTAIAPLMARLVARSANFLEPRHTREDPARYARNAIYIAPENDLSLFAIVWLPGQWTPVHDHGSWGVVGVVRGVLEERSYMCPDGEIRADQGIRLRRGGIVLLGPGSITSFVPNPDHIHMTGVAADRERTVSLHLYGRTMSSFHIYDTEAGTRRLIDVSYNES
jgi:3-mercaptopropionate dioxygenase